MIKFNVKQIPERWTKTNCVIKFRHQSFPHNVGGDHLLASRAAAYKCIVWFLIVQAQSCVFVFLCPISDCGH